MTPAGTLPVAVDAMGGDNAPAAAVAGCVRAADEAGCDVVLVGRRQQLIHELAAAGGRDHVVAGRLQVVDASEVVGMDEHPAAAVRSKRDSSIVRMCELVAGGRASAAVSAGNSGAVLAAAVARVRRLPGVARPAIAVHLPTATGSTLLLDAGANADCRPEWLAQFGVMGSVHSRALLGVARPRVRLLSNGEEEGKGSSLVQAASPLLAASPVDFRGNAEARDIFRGVCDVAVTDGFTGNAVLKAAEGVAELLFAAIRRELAGSPRAQAGAWLLRPRLRRVRDRADYRRTGGALLLGVAGEVVIAHGRSDSVALAAAIGVAHRAATERVSARIAEEMASSATPDGSSRRPSPQPVHGGPATA